MSGSLLGRAAVVTGGGRGIGASIARALAASGVRVAVAARTLSQVQEIAAEIEAAGGTALAVSCDVTNEASVLRMHDTAVEAFGAIDILVNNAGVSHSAPIAKTTLEDWNRMIAVNATGAFLCTRAFLPAMQRADFGRVINIASVAGLHGARYIAAYTASKHALIGLTRAVAADVAGSGVTCNAICPTYVDTPMTQNTIANVVARTGKSAEESLALVLAAGGQSRLVPPDAVARAVLSLCDAGSNAMNGESLIVDEETH